MENISAEDFNFFIPKGEPVTIKLMGNMLIDNRNYENRSAIDLEDGATLNLYVFGNVEVNSSFGALGGDGSSADKLYGGPGANAGIHVTKNSVLNLYGTGTIKCFGGDAGNGGTCPTNSYDAGGGGGGGAGAGIGGGGASKLLSTSYSGGNGGKAGQGGEL